MSQGYAWIPQSGTGSNIELRFNVVPSGQCDGGNTHFLLPETPLGGVAVLLNGMRVHPNDFTLSGPDIYLSQPPSSGEHVVCDYAVAAG